MGKIIITGSGRAGTSFLLLLLNRLGFDTGYPMYQEPYNDGTRAGCEWQINATYEEADSVIKAAIDEAPRVMKSPEWGLMMKEFVRRGIMEVDHCYIPVRDLDVAAASRIDAGLFWQVCETDAYNYLVMDQASVHALALGRALEACLMCDIPYTIMLFPRLVTDEGYCWCKLTEGVAFDTAEYHRLYEQMANPAQIKFKDQGGNGNRQVTKGAVGHTP
jgi:hypothetical protein